MSSTEHKELKSGWKSSGEAKQIKKSEVQRHKSKGDLWMIIHNKVYDVSEYVKDHPGGQDTLLEVAGVDATGGFEDVGHSQDAREILKSYLIGNVEGAEPESSETGDGEALPDVEVVRRDESPKNERGSRISMKARIELAASGLGTAGLVWALNRYHVLSGLHGGHGSFTQGFLLACITAGAIGYTGLRYLDKATDTPGFQSYTSHTQSSIRRRGSFHPAGVLVPQEYRKFRLNRKEELSDGIWRFVFDLPTKWSVLGLPIGQHIAIKADIDEHTVVRSYTPITNNRDLGRLELLIRVYPKGQMGNFLKELNVGDTAEIRGPKGAMRYRKGMGVRSIGMIAGGTGITPMFQIIRAICEDPADDTTVSLIYANRSESDIMLRDRLDAFAKSAGHKFQVYYVLDEPPPGWEQGKGRVTKELLADRLPQPSSDTQTMLCGPPPMVNAMKKNLVEIGFEEPGAVSRMTDQIFCF